ncbi:MAG: hypothetical protein WCL51_00620 [Bacteroidota bacterium]
MVKSSSYINNNRYCFFNYQSEKNNSTMFYLDFNPFKRNLSRKDTNLTTYEGSHYQEDDWHCQRKEAHSRLNDNHTQEGDGHSR